MQPAPVLPIRFDRTKYGSPLLVDACEIADLPTFITAPRAHRLHFWEVALLSGGSGRLALDDASHALGTRRVLVTAPGDVRRWELDGRAGLAGWLLFFEPGYLDEASADPAFLRELPILAAPALARGLAPSAARFDALAAIVAAMREELRDLHPDSRHELRAQTCRLLLGLQRAAADAGRVPTARPAARDPAQAACERFRALLDEGVGAATPVASYARRLGLSPRRLNECLRARTGRSAGELVDERLMREARRLLLHTALPAAAVAERLEFADPSYFGRFFRRHAGTTPAAFRRAHGSASAPPLRALSGDED